MKPERRWIYVLLERITLAFSHFNYSQNPEDVPVAIEERIVRADRILQIGNGIALGRFDPGRFSRERRTAIRAALGIGDEHVLIGMVGRLVEERATSRRSRPRGSARLASARAVRVRRRIRGQARHDRGDRGHRAAARAPRRRR